MDELNMNIEKKNIYKLSHKWYISVCSIILFILLYVLSACCWWFFLYFTPRATLYGIIDVWIDVSYGFDLSWFVLHFYGLFIAFIIWRECVCACVCYYLRRYKLAVLCCVVCVCLFNIGWVRLRRDVISRHSSTIAKMKIEL